VQSKVLAANTPMYLTDVGRLTTVSAPGTSVIG